MIAPLARRTVLRAASTSSAGVRRPSLPASRAPEPLAVAVVGRGNVARRRFASAVPDFDRCDEGAAFPSTARRAVPSPSASSTAASSPIPSEGPRTSVLMELTDRVGALHDVLRFFWKYDVNATRIESRPASVDDAAAGGGPKFDFFVDFRGRVADENVTKLLTELKKMTDKLLVLDEKEVHWFPRHVSELDLVANRTLDAGTDLEADHPGFHDADYRERRAKLAKAALNHRMHHEIPRTEYSKEEVETWGVKSMRLMKEHCGYSRSAIPQLADVASFLRRRTDFRLRPVAGLISSRDFLNGLAFR
ncbi:hypothetical protein ACHAWF_002315, partial [Thalassiosira exigua]